jgi:hypothetical protein
MSCSYLGVCLECSKVITGEHTEHQLSAGPAGADYVITLMRGGGASPTELTFPDIIDSAKR